MKVCRHPGCKAEAMSGSLRCSTHDHRIKVPPAPHITLGPGQGQRPHFDGFPTFEPPLQIPEPVRAKLLDALEEGEARVVLALIDAGLSSINLRRAESDFRRKDLLLRAVDALRMHEAATRDAEELLERTPRTSVGRGDDGVGVDDVE